MQRQHHDFQRSPLESLVLEKDNQGDQRRHRTEQYSECSQWMVERGDIRSEQLGDDPEQINRKHQGGYYSCGKVILPVEIIKLDFPFSGKQAIETYVFAVSVIAHLVLSVLVLELQGHRALVADL